MAFLLSSSPRVGSLGVHLSRTSASFGIGSTSPAAALERLDLVLHVLEHELERDVGPVPLEPSPKLDVLVARCDPPYGSGLQRTLDRGARIVALDEPDRHAILRVLEDCPDQLLELRATLVQEAAWVSESGSSPSAPRSPGETTDAPGVLRCARG